MIDKLGEAILEMAQDAVSGVHTCNAYANDALIEAVHAISKINLYPILNEFKNTQLKKLDQIQELINELHTAIKGA